MHIGNYTTKYQILKKVDIIQDSFDLAHGVTWTDIPSSSQN